MSEGQPIGEAEIRARELQGILKTFASLDTPSRERGLPIMFNVIRSHTTPEVLAIATNPLNNPDLGDRDYRPSFRGAIGEAMDFSFITPNGEKKSWEGGYTVVMMNRQGILLAADANPEGKVYEKYGKNLFPYALFKAVILLHLELAGRSGGLQNEENFRYLRELGFEHGRELFKGAVIHPGGHAILGASGCELSEEYMNSLLPASMVGRNSVNFLAGYADRCFALMVGGQSAFHSDTRTLKEPKLFAELRRAH